jgi:hypothetical protein
VRKWFFSISEIVARTRSAGCVFVKLAVNHREFPNSSSYLWLFSAKYSEQRSQNFMTWSTRYYHTYITVFGTWRLCNVGFFLSDIYRSWTNDEEIVFVIPPFPCLISKITKVISTKFGIVFWHRTMSDEFGFGLYLSNITPCFKWSWNRPSLIFKKKNCKINNWDYNELSS